MNRNHANAKNNFQFSIITPVKNDEHMLKLIESYRQAKTNNTVEHLIVCNGSCKKFTKKIERSIQALKTTKILVLQDSNIAASINYAIKKANASTVVIVDSDCFMDGNFVASMTRAIKNNLAVRGKVVFKGHNPLSRLNSKLRSHIYETESNLFFAPNLALNKSLFKQIGYFNENLHSWDSEFGYRANKHGINITHENSAIVTHNCGDDLFNEAIVSIKYGEGRAYCYQRGLLGNKSLSLLVKTMSIPCVFSVKESPVYNLYVLFYSIIWNYGFLKLLIFKPAEGK